MFWQTRMHTYTLTFRNYFCVDAFHYLRGRASLPLSVCWPACLPICLRVCLPDTRFLFFLFFLPCLLASLSTYTPSVLVCVCLEAALSLTVCFCPSALSDICLQHVCILLANQRNKGGLFQSCSCVELLKNKKPTAQQCTQTNRTTLTALKCLHTYSIYAQIA